MMSPSGGPGGLLQRPPSPNWPTRWRGYSSPWSSPLPSSPAMCWLIATGEDVTRTHRRVAVLVISCPAPLDCTPVAIMVSTGKGAVAASLIRTAGS